MADPITLMGIGMAATAIGGGVSAYGSYQSGQASSAAARYQAAYAQQLAGAYRTRGQQMQAAGYQQAADVGLRYGAQAARETVFAGAGNVAGGSPTAVIASTRALGQLAQRTTIANAGERAYGEYLRGAEETAKAGLETAAARQYQIAGDIGAIGTAASTIGKLTSMAGDVQSVDPKWLPENYS